jgi:hypothetical protein
MPYTKVDAHKLTTKTRIISIPMVTAIFRIPKMTMMSEILREEIILAKLMATMLQVSDLLRVATETTNSS